MCSCTGWGCGVLSPRAVSQLGKALADHMAAEGGLITLADLEAYKVAERYVGPVAGCPTAGTYRGYTIVGCPLCSAGGVHLVQMLNMLELFDVQVAAASAPRSSRRRGSSADTQRRRAPTLPAAESASPPPPTGTLSERRWAAASARAGARVRDAGVLPSAL